jgi:hypothetical protein
LYFNPRPTSGEIERLAAVLGIDRAVLAGLFPGVEMAVSLRPIRLCGACYGEVACHRMEWQFKETEACGRHGLRLLAECPSCGARFRVPALWSGGCCHRCFTSFNEMSTSQKNLN